MTLPGEKLDSRHHLYKDHLLQIIWGKIWIDNTKDHTWHKCWIQDWRGPYETLEEMEKAITK